MTLRAFSLEPEPSLPAIETPWIVLEVLPDGAPRVGVSQLMPVFSSRNAAEIFIALDEATDAPVTPHMVDMIERFAAEYQEANLGLAEFAEWADMPSFASQESA